MDHDDLEESNIWKVTRDDKGNAVLGWTAESHAVDPEPEQEPDELAQTYSYLRRLDLSKLELEGENEGAETEDGFDPYNTGAWRKCSRL